jgi:hypothetical protein
MVKEGPWNYADTTSKIPSKTSKYLHAYVNQSLKKLISSLYVIVQIMTLAPNTHNSSTFCVLLLLPREMLQLIVLF